MTNKSQPTGLNKTVFISSSALIMLLLVYAVIWPKSAENNFNSLQDVIIKDASWFYILSVAIILVYVIFLCVSKYGDIRLGPDHSKPAYSMMSWISMLFAAGMGIGLMFFSVAEPIMHYSSPPNAAPETIEAAREAMRTTFFHWGLHAWAIYAVVALILAYFAFRMNLPLTLRSALYPFIGNKIYGWPGHLVDIFAAVGTVFGVATSLGLGASQVNSGFHYLFGIEVNNLNQIILMSIIIGFAIISVVSGLDKGIKRLSETNMGLALGLLLLVFILGPTVFLLSAYVQNIGDYLSHIVRSTFNLYAYQKTEWIGGWTLFYWGWWLAWAPFVGLFIARISRGRTIRQFIVGVLIIPSAFTMFWMTIFGNSAIEMVSSGKANDLVQMVSENTSVALFVFLEHFPFTEILAGLTVLMIVIFFVTSCDSGAMVIDMLCSYGNNNTPVWQRIYWAICVGLVAGILLLAGGLNSLQTMTIASALPFTIVLMLSMGGLIKALRVETFKQESFLLTSFPHAGAENKSWRERLTKINHYPTKENIDKFIENTVNPAFIELQEEFNNLGETSTVEESDKGWQLRVSLDDSPDFIYAVYRHKNLQPNLSDQDMEVVNDDPDNDDHHYYRAVVHLTEGGQDYDVMGWSKLGVINDVIDQYYKHRYFIYLLN
ncbi:BCCT family transporter [Thalassotalea litorea]|uniref:BCCT family transporter n=1 Tax=Thalassotalea litorea TaxID=2020715 RepID=A0A5R9IGA2_9GAMM|nr:choline BCCT transporter BetT [Thalassotalea litorea]TLU61680.1 BCCT family transporter [Thalassotalea litorea]